MSYKYAYRELDSKTYEKTGEIIDRIKNNISVENIGYDFTRKKDELKKGIDELFDLIAKKEEYIGEDDEFDVENIQNNDEWSIEKIEERIRERGFGIDREKMKEILSNFRKSDIFQQVNSSEMEDIKTMTRTRNVSKEQIYFMRKVKFVSTFINERYRMYNSSVDKTSFKEKEDLLAQSAQRLPEGIYDLDSFDVNGESLGEIATNLLREQNKKSEEGPDSGRISPRENPVISLVCGLPGLGKSSVYINKLKQGGACCFDLDEIALDVAKRYGVILNKKTSNNI